MKTKKKNTGIQTVTIDAIFDNNFAMKKEVREKRFEELLKKVDKIANKYSDAFVVINVSLKQ